MSITSHIYELRESIATTARKAGRDPGSIRLVLVTKTVPAETVLEAYQAGERDFGENRVQEWQDKKDALPTDIRWHLIGHLQTNKVKYLIGKVALIHSLDRIELADEIEKQAAQHGVAEVPCLLQVNMSGEDTKFGVAPQKAEELAAQIALRTRIKLKGIMTIGPLTEEEGKIRECFRRSKALLGELSRKMPQHAWDILSMGMSADYRVAVEEGATMLRIGTLVFGERKR